MLNFYKLEQQIEEEIKAAQVPGLALAIIQNQEIIYARGFGLTSIADNGLPVTPLTLFRIGSITKPLTGTALMRLVESGLLNLEQPVKEYVEWFTLSKAKAADQVTLRMLMSHTAGLPTDYKLFGRRDPDGLGAYVREEIPRYPLIAPPGKVYSYSNPGINVAGYIAEVVSGNSFTELMQALVFDPLEMQRTTFDPTVAMTYPLAQSHYLNEDGKLSLQHRFADNTAEYPSGYVMSTVFDLANFAIMQMNQGRFRSQQILLPESVVEMQTTQADLYTTIDAGYGLTFETESYKGIRQVKHDGAISNIGGKFVMAPDVGIAIVILFNHITTGFAVDKVLNHIFDQLLDLPKETPKPQAIEPKKSLWPLYTGLYLGWYCGLATISVLDGRLTLDWNGEVVYLNSLKKDLYFGQKPDSKETISVGFLLEEEKPTQYIVIDGSVCKRIKHTKLAPTPINGTAYVGRYTGELDTLSIRIEDDHLLLYSKRLNKEVPCIPLVNDCFACEYGVFEFKMAHDSGVQVLKLRKTLTLTRVKES